MTKLKYVSMKELLEFIENRSNPQKKTKLC